MLTQKLIQLFVFRKLLKVPKGFQCNRLSCDQIWRKFAALVKHSKSLAICLMVYLVLGNILSPFWLKICALRHLSIVLNGKILNKYYSHLVTLLCPLKADSHLPQQSAFSPVDYVNAEIEQFLSLCRNVTVCHRCMWKTQ